MVSHLVSLTRIVSALNNPITHYPITTTFTVSLSASFPCVHLEYKAAMALKSHWIQTTTSALIICDFAKINYHI